jgi:hypothetical protein
MAIAEWKQLKNIPKSMLDFCLNLAIHPPVVSVREAVKDSKDRSLCASSHHTPAHTRGQNGQARPRGTRRRSFSHDEIRLV